MPIRTIAALLLAALPPACLHCLPPPRPALQGTVLKGTKPFPWARIYILASPQASGSDTMATSLIQENMGQIDTGTGASKGFRYVSADGQGRFVLYQTLSCAPDQQVYLYVTEADQHSPAAELAVLGSCPARGSFDGTYAHIVINEVTTIAAAYALAPYATDPTHFLHRAQGVENFALIRRDFADAARFVDLQTGELRTQNVPLATARQESILKVHSLANALNACDIASAPDSRNSKACVELFAATTEAGLAEVSADTAVAAMRMGRHPAAHTHELFVLAKEEAVFTPALAAEPNDFTLSMQDDPPD